VGEPTFCECQELVHFLPRDARLFKAGVVAGEAREELQFNALASLQPILGLRFCPASVRRGVDREKA
jgi:hypothetical protein